jgi:hypothetical protein
MALGHSHSHLAFNFPASRVHLTVSQFKSIIALRTALLATFAVATAANLAGSYGLLFIYRPNLDPNTWVVEIDFQ